MGLTIEELLNQKYREYSMYVIYSRAIPSICDGLKLVQKRALWVAKDHAKNLTKVNTLAGIAVRLHPHGDTSVQDAISNLAQDFAGGNNYPLFYGDGAFGSRLTGPGNGIGAARYVSVKLSDFTKKVMFKDMDLIEIIPNYDGEFTECQNFLPLVPTVLLNGVSGIAVGYATEIQPHNIEDIIKLQLKVLKGHKLTDKDIPLPWFKGFKGTIYRDPEGVVKCRGVYKLEKTNLTITELPIGWNREHFKVHLEDLLEKGVIRDFENNSKDGFLFNIKLGRGQEFTEEWIIKTFKLETNLNQNLNVINTKGKLWTYSNVCEIIEDFTKWRFTYFKKRYELYVKNLMETVSYNEVLLKFIRMVIATDFVKKISTMKKSDIVSYLEKEKWEYIDRLIQVPIYHFNKEKIQELVDLLEKDKKQIAEWIMIIGSEEKRNAIYQGELKDVVKI